MVTDRIDAIARQLNALIQSQLDTLKKENLSRISQAELEEYDRRFLRIRALCQDLDREERLLQQVPAGA